MKIKKRIFKVIIIFSLLFFVSAAFTFFTGYSLVLPISTNKKLYLNAEFNPGDTLAIFSKFDFTKDNWKAYLVISHDDLKDLNPAISKFTCLKTSNRKLLLQMQKSWKFKITNGDGANSWYPDHSWDCLFQKLEVLRAGNVLETSECF